MPCATCEERAKLLVGAMKAFNRGDFVEAESIFKEIFGTVKVDFKNISAAFFKGKTMTNPGGGHYSLKDGEIMDPDTARRWGHIPDHVHTKD